MKRCLPSMSISMSMAIAAALLLLLATACIGRLAPAPTPAPPPGPTPTPLRIGLSPVTVEPPMTAADFPTPPDRDLTELARQFRWQGTLPEPKPPRFANQNLQVGHTTEFWIADLVSQSLEQRPFRLAHISASAYWWFEDGIEIDAAEMSRAAAEAERRVLAPVYAAFAPDGTISNGITPNGTMPDGITPDGTIDNNGPPLHIINAGLRGVGGYVAAADAFPAAVAPYSNEINAIYINIVHSGLSGNDYLATLAHELQHAIHNQADATEDGWLNEGMAELAVAEAGLDTRSAFAYLERPSTSLVNWPAEIGPDTGLHYGAAALFAHYLRQHYAGGAGLAQLLAEPADGIAGINNFLARNTAAGADSLPFTFRNLFSDWMVANLLDRLNHPHGYNELDVRAAHRRRIRPDDTARPTELSQYGVDYILVRDVNGTVDIRFSGAATTNLLPTTIPDGSCWWSNRGDNITTTLTAQVAVPAADPDGANAELSFLYWHRIENEWDYAYIAASPDDGATWQALPAAGTTDADPVGNSYGPGYTGDSDGWQRAAVSLSDYAGQDILLRFQYVTDEAIHAPGFCVREPRLSPAVAPAAANADIDDDAALIPVDDWEPDGFVRVSNRVLQEWLVWVIVEGRPPSATRMTLHHDADAAVWHGSAKITAGSGDTVTVAVAPLAPATKEKARYQVWAAPTQ